MSDNKIVQKYNNYLPPVVTDETRVVHGLFSNFTKEKIEKARLKIQF